MALQNEPNLMSQRERDEFEQDKIMAEMQSEHSLKLKRMEVEVAKIEAHWTSLFKLPLAIIMLPVRVLLAIAYIISMFTKHPQPDEFWLFMGVKK